MKLSELLIPLCLALGIGFDTLNMTDDDQASITAGIAKLTEKVTAQTQELKDLGTKVAGIPALQALADIASAHITNVRSTTLASYKKSVGDESKIDANIVLLIEKPETNLETLISLKSSYDAKVEEMFPLKCQDCDSVNVSRASSKGEGESTEIVKNTSNEDIFETLYKGKL